MQTKYINRNNVIAAFLLTAFSAGLVLQSTSARAQDFTAGSVLEKMTTTELNAYLTGVVDGLAYARYKKEGRQTNGGMKCIYDWFFNGGQTVKQIVQAFKKFSKHEPNAIIAAMIVQRCGE